MRLSWLDNNVERPPWDVIISDSWFDFLSFQEFFLLLMKEILDPKFGMFRTIEENNLIWFNKHVSPLDKIIFLS